ncbi:MAG TPA: helix-turn-helix transcriptional regulator, partial [Micromonosporaceae bacterium]|nr:helix-turn-helix transcriptional regulator [Micromonosporaceae bacterium]
GLFLLGRLDEAIAVVDGQIAATPGRAALHAQRAVLLAFAGRRADALDEAEIAAAATPASPAEEVVVCGQLAMLTSMAGRHAQTVEFADRALRSAGSSTMLQLQALAVAASTGALAGLVHDASWRLRRADRLTGEAGSAYAFSGELGLTRIVLDWLGGRWDAALDGLRTVRPELETREQATLAAALTAVELEIRTWRGELVPAGRLAARAVPAARNMSELHAYAVAGYLAACGDVEGARRTLRAALADPRTAPYGSLLLARLLELDQDSPGETNILLETLIEVATPQISPWSKTTLHRMVGTVRSDRESLAVAVREAEAGGLVFERARAQLALGELAADAGDELVEAYRTFARLGAHGLRRRAGRRLHELGEKVPRSRSRAAGLLTESEERVARLVQQGMRNREIAAALHYSPRSIEVYLSRIYGKLRVSSRLELARALDAMDSSA